MFSDLPAAEDFAGEDYLPAACLLLASSCLDAGFLKATDSG